MLLRAQKKPWNGLLPVLLCIWLVSVMPAIAQAQYWQSELLDSAMVHQYEGGFLGGGLSSADFDKDGYDDLLFCQRASNPVLLKSNQGVLQPWPLHLFQ